MVQLVCLMPFPRQNLLNSSAVSCGRLSVTIWSGIPYLENNNLRMSAIFSAVVEVIAIASGQALTMMSHIHPSKGLQNQHDATSRAVVVFPMNEVEP